MTTSSQRQDLRTKQSGRLRRSTIFALIGVAAVALTATQIPRLITAFDSNKEKFIAWSASQGFTVQHVDVAGRKIVPTADVLQALNIQRGLPILSYDLKSAQEKLSQNPWFKTVTIERRLPQTIFVEVLERIPAARWQVNGKLAVVDGEGVVLTADNLDKYQNLPIIIGPEAQHKVVDLFMLLKGEPSIGSQVAAASWIGNRRWDLTLQNGIVIKLPADQPELALSKLASYDRGHQVFARDIKAVDLRLPDRAVIQPTARANVLIERPDFSDTPDNSKKNI
jgi:cell division protein FtsQ